MTRKTLFVLSFLIVIVIMYLITNYYNKKHAKQILMSPAFTNCFFEYVKYEKGKGDIYYYHFNVENRKYINGETDGRLRKIYDSVFKRSFPVIYKKEDPSKNRVLIFPSDFMEFNIPFPDSLSWVKKYE